MILEAVGLDYTLRARKVARESKNPLRLVAEASSSHNFRSTVDDFQDWSENRAEQFKIS